MKYPLLFLLILLIITGTSFAQPRVGFVRCYGGEGSQRFNDIYATVDGGYIMCGSSETGNARQIYVVKADGGGNEVLSETFGGGSAHTIIELDNGDFAIGGSGNGVMVARITSEGELRWIRRYERGVCYALIELKNNDLALAGYASESRNGLLMRLESDDGDVVWQIEYEEYDFSRFHGLREVEEGLVAAGHALTHRSALVLLGKFAQADGELVWMQEYIFPNPPSYDFYDVAFALTSHLRGFVMSGVHNWTHVDTPSEGLTRFTDEDGNETWHRIRTVDEDGFAMNWYGICRLTNGDFVQAGIAGWNSNHPVMNWINANGDELWFELYQAEDLGNFEPDAGYFKSVVEAQDGSVVACGNIIPRDADGLMDGFIMKLEPLIASPIIYFRSPEDSVLTVLQDDALRFTVGARNVLNNEMSYLWLRNGIDTLATDTTVLVHFPELGQDTIDCQISSGEHTALARWLVNVTAFYISDFTPDSLDIIIRRNTSVDFSLAVRQLVDDDVNYLWTLTDRQGHDHEIGETDSVTVLFDLKGEHQVEGLAWRGDLTDEIAWSIDVRSVIWSWLPFDLELSVPVDTTIDFEVVAFNDESDSLSFRWWLNNDLLEVDSTADSVMIDFPELGLQALMSVVRDGVEADTVIWEINVFEPDNAVKIPDMPLPECVSLSEPYPNPFNSTTTITYGLAKAAPTRIAIYDLTGREIVTLVNDRLESGYYNVVWNAAEFPSGLYICRMDAGVYYQSRKLVLVR